jgi:putative DNA primase/helicase
MIQQNFPTFSILDHLDRLNVVKETSTDYHCTCPVCGDGGFKIEKRSGKYNTFKCGCMDTPEGKKAVINELAPRDNNQKAPRPKQVRRWIYRDRQGHPLVQVCREDFGEGKTPKRWQESWNGTKWVKGLGEIQRPEIPIYKYQEVIEAIALGKTIFIAEGEPACDALWELGLAATTNIGGAGKWKASDSKDLVGAKVVLCPDRDQPGVKHSELIAEHFPEAQWLYAFPNSPFWYNLPANQGLDVADWIADFQLSAADIWEAVEPHRQGLPDPKIPTTPPLAQKNYVKMCLDALYSDTRWVAVGGQLYEWVGTHYQSVYRESQIRRIADWCDTTPVLVGKTWKYALATPYHVESIWKWLLQHFAVSADKINPPGFNCLNGVVKIHWNGPRADWILQPHNPDEIYTYVSEIEFDPDADSTDCDRMLSCLEPSQQKLFIQTMAASLDLDTIRKYGGRTVRALLCKGDGNNGKDALREAVRMLFGSSMSYASVSDFAAYDRGRKFGLAKLAGAKINWSSENSNFDSLDGLQSLKAAITGDPLNLEYKGMNEQTMMPSSIFLFNVNEAPNLKAGMEAIQSRWGVLSFNKTYKVGANPSKGEIEADSRFRYDPQFLKKQVCPALLNKMLAALSTLAIDGINYGCTAEALQNIQQEANHLWAFAQDVGLNYDSDGRIYITDLWERLQSWYIDNGTLEIVTSEGGKEKKIWHDQPRRGDKNVKAPNQVYQRFAELFPKIKRGVENGHHPTHAKQSYLIGISFGETNQQLIGNQGEVNEELNGESKNLDTVSMGSQLSHFSQVGEIFEQVGNDVFLDAFLSRLNSNQLMELQSKINQLASRSDTERVIGCTTNLPTGLPTESQLPSQAEPVRVLDSGLDEASEAQLASQPDTEGISALSSLAQELADEAIDLSEQPEKEQESVKLGSHNSCLIDWVRYQGEPWIVARQENGWLWLRKSGFTKINHKVHVSQVEICGYKNSEL